MAGSLRVLIVDDSEDDAQLLLIALARGGWQVQHERVCTAAAMAEALDAHSWDLIISDYSMPQFSGPAALKLARERACNLPFIIVSGKIGEETAVQAMKAGADDYLFKGNLTRLVPAVERELRDAEERRKGQQTEQELREVHGKLAKAQGLIELNRELQVQIAERQFAQHALQELNETLERRVAERSAAAEAANLAKSEFLANMSHEIRTPISAIVGFADMMRRTGPAAPDHAECVQAIRRNARHLLELINEILDLSKIEAGQMTVERIRCDLPHLLAEIASLMRSRATEKSLQFKLACDGSLPRFICTDPLRLRQILVNLIGNAIKFTTAGSTEIRICCQQIEQSGLLRVWVCDTGIGMSTEQLSRIFQPFTQGEQSTTRKFGGTGLGLTISRRLARLLGGDIAVTSEPGVGSTFNIWIDSGPIENAEMVSNLTDADLSMKVSDDGSGGTCLHGHILLVEDGRDNQRLLSAQLKMAGAQVVIAENGQAAIDLVATQPFDLVLMDMQMPIVDGYTATKELRRRGFAMPIIALTAYAMSEDRSKCVACGCTDYLTKPVDGEILLQTISYQLGQRAAPALPQAPRLELEKKADPVGPIKSSMSKYPGMSQIIREFVRDLPSAVEELQGFLRKGDMNSLGRRIHQLRGACGGYGFDGVTEIAAAAEDAIKAADSLPSITERTNSLIHMISAIDGFGSTTLAALEHEPTGVAQAA